MFHFVANVDVLCAQHSKTGRRIKRELAGTKGFVLEEFSHRCEGKGSE